MRRQDRGRRGCSCQTASPWAWPLHRCRASGRDRRGWSASAAASARARSRTCGQAARPRRRVAAIGVDAGRPAHAVIDILVAGGREDLVDQRESRRPTAAGRATARASSASSRRDRRRVALRPPIGLVAAAEHIMQLEEVDDPVPAVAEQLIEALGMDGHRPPARAGNCRPARAATVRSARWPTPPAAR